MPLRVVGYDPGTRNSKAAVLEKDGSGWILQSAAFGPAQDPKAFWEASKLPRGTLCVAAGAQAFTLR